MKPPPSNWPRISSAVYYEEAAEAIDWLCRAFGFEVRLKVVGEDGRIKHSQLMYGEGLVMVAQVDAPGKPSFRRSPRSLGGAQTQNMMIFVDDADTHCEHARAAGAIIVSEPKTTDFGADYWTDRGYECKDLEGHHWWFFQRLRDQQPKS